MPVKVAINGFGRIGRVAFRLAQSHPEIEIVAINARTKPPMLAHLLKYDSSYGIYPGKIEVGEDYFQADGRKVRCTAVKDPVDLPWAEMGVDIVIESTGQYRKRDEFARHLTAGAKKVIISSPAKGDDITLVMGVNDEKYDPAKHHLISNASCTTNCLAPVAKVINDNFGIVKGLMTTVHAYTNDQQILDKSHDDLRRARAAAVSIIPTSTGAAQAIGTVIPELAGKLNGFAMRVPTPTVSTLDLVVELSRTVTAEEVNDAFRESAAGRMKGYLEVTDEPLVSVDFRGNPASAIVDALSTMVIGGNMLKVIAWYDNEWGYASRVIDLALYLAKQGV